MRPGGWSMAGAGSAPKTGRRPESISPRSICMAMAGSIARRRPPAAAPLSYDFDPSHPVPTIGGAMSSLDPVAYAGAWDQTEGPDFFGCTPPYLPLASRRDVLVFQTAPLDAPLQVVGPIEAELFVATDGPDTDFTAKLIDVHPPSADYPKGYAMILTDGIMRLRYAEDPAHPRLRSPGEVVKIRITLFPTANLFLPGHRIRLDISSSNFPKFDVNPNTGEPEGVARRRRIAVNTVFVDAATDPAGWCCHCSPFDAIALADWLGEDGMMNDLYSFYAQHRNTRVMHKWDHYFEIYDRFLSPIRRTNPVVLEIGVQLGGSWRCGATISVPPTHIFGIDIDPAPSGRRTSSPGCSSATSRTALSCAVCCARSVRPTW